ncbi:glycosyltransferase family 2 protein [Pediococcus pentosaceus]|uniref:glycosyltransferase family 2 protein n=1 Tax=Pediococcus pentosaceus TaxID=1255 RepID=UPI002073825A|nr:glycosyltransferase family A protein [Pediococcus pentosaceus]MCM6819408.1 glycosyltransferase family 2 protein [Pediococcus pentosaceus]
MPTFNSADTVLETLESVVKTKESDLEILIVDDGSTDGTVELIKNKKIPNVTILNSPHMGPANIKNFAIKHITGEFVCFIDSDDLLDINYFKILRKVLISKPELMIFNYAVFNEHEINSRSLRKVSPTISEMGTMTWNKVYSASLIKKIAFPSDTTFEDVGFSAQAYLLSDNTIYVDEVLYYYRQRFGSITKNPDKPVYVHLDIIKGFEEMFSFIRKHSLNLQEKEKRDISILVNNNLLMHIRKILSLYNVDNREVKSTIGDLLKYKKKMNIFLGKKYNFLFSNKRTENLKFQVMFFLIKIRAWRTVKLIISRNKKF